MNLAQHRKTEAVGVVVPVHNEQDHLGPALDALRHSLDRLPADLPAHTVVVLDACSDGSSQIAQGWRQRLGEGRATLLVVDQGNVGRARAAGCDLLMRWHRGAEHSLWLSSTDADSQVPPGWLSRQVALHEEGIALWNGIVAVDDWTGRPGGLAAEWRRFYRSDRTPIHGASLGINAHVYRRAGGFPALATGEDRALHAAAVASGATVHYDRSVPVITSARRAGRAPQGFAGTLTFLEAAPGLTNTPDPDPPRAVLSS